MTFSATQGLLLSLVLETGLFIFMGGLELGRPDGPGLVLLGASGATLGLILLLGLARKAAQSHLA